MAATINNHSYLARRMTNSALSDSFSLLSKLMDIHGENSFKAKSYANAAFQIDRLPVELSTLPRNQIQGQPGIGESVAKKVVELLDTNELSALSDLLKKTPEGILELLKIKGIGPKKIAVIWKELGVESPGELLYACEENRLIHYKGFGEKTQRSIQEALEFYFSNQGRYLYAQIEPYVNQLHEKFVRLFSVDSVWVTGSFRRQCEIIDEIEFVIEADPDEIVEQLSGSQQFALLEQDDEKLSYKVADSLTLFIYPCDAASSRQVLFFTTGTADFTDAFDRQFPEIDYSILEGDTDEGAFDQAGIPFIIPALREDSTILQRSQNSYESLIEFSDIKGIIHTHSTWSDGLNTLEEMAMACKQQGYEYLVISDHSVTSYYANGLNADRVRQQHAEIDRLNASLHPFKIFKSIECDILGDGQLDYDDAILSTFDLVICSVHQNLKMTEEKAMHRLMGAISNPYTTILGHLSGRLLLSRKGYPLDYAAIIQACKEYQVVIELNANPRRLDIDWRWIQQAIDAGVLLSINPDAHHISGIADNRFGVLAAQKGLMKASHNLSSLSLQEFELFLQQKSAFRQSRM